MTTPSTTENVGGVPGEQASEFLSGLTREDLEKIYSAGEAQQFVKGDSMLTEGGSDASVYIVLQGQAQVLILREAGWLNVASLQPGSVFGELSFFDRMPRSARVSALEECAVLKISQDSFQRLAATDPRLALTLALELGKILSLRVRHLNDLIQTLRDRQPGSGTVRAAAPHCPTLKEGSMAAGQIVAIVFAAVSTTILVMTFILLRRVYLKKMEQMATVLGVERETASELERVGQLRGAAALGRPVAISPQALEVFLAMRAAGSR